MSPPADRPRPGAFKRVTSFSNPAVKEIRALQLKKFRDRTGLFLAEGHKLARDALEAGWPIATLLVTEDAGEAALATAARARAAGATVVETTGAIMERIARKENAQPVVGVYRQRLATLAPDALGPGDVWIALEGPRDPGNLGTIVRTADGLGAKGVALVGPSVDPFGIEAVRASMGSLFHVPLARLSADDFAAFRAGFRGKIYGTHLAGTVDVRGFRPETPCVLLMGTEQSGLTDAAAGLCDALVRVPMAGAADSLNLAVATAIVLFEARRDVL